MCMCLLVEMWSSSTQGSQKRVSDPVVLITGCSKPLGVGSLQEQDVL